MAPNWNIQVLEGGVPSAGITLEEGETAIMGRDPAVDLVLRERSVSRRHCELLATSEGIHLLDLGSANGITLRGRRVKEGILKPGEEAEVGLARVLVERSPSQTGLISPPDLAASPSSAAFSPDSLSQQTRPSSARIGGSGSNYRGLAKERLALLIETGLSLASLVDLDDLLQRIMERLFQIMPVKRALLVLLTPGGELCVRYSRPAIEDGGLSRFCSQHIIRQVIKSGEAVIIQDATQEQALSKAQSILISNIKAAICAPLVSHTQTIGALYADYPGRARIYKEEDREFLGAFASFAAVAIENARMNLELRARERLQRHLEIAAEIQRSILPESFDHKNLEVDWAYLPSHEVGGDFYDCFNTPDGRVALILGDVAGKSIGAALLMARLMAVLRASALEDASPSRVLSRANRLLGGRGSQVLYATACVLMLDPGPGEYTFASAGHNPVLILPPKSSQFEELGSTGVPLGVEETWDWKETRGQVEPDSLIVLYTDGIVEARDKQGNMLGLSAAERIILDNRDKKPRHINRALLDGALDWSRESPKVRDDIALLIARVRGPK